MVARASRQSATAGDFMARQPNITIWTGGTEAPDETAYGDWMTLVATSISVGESASSTRQRMRPTTMVVKRAMIWPTRLRWLK